MHYENFSETFPKINGGKKTFFFINAFLNLKNILLGYLKVKNIFSIIIGNSEKTVVYFLVLIMYFSRLGNIYLLFTVKNFSIFLHHRHYDGIRQEIFQV